MKYVILVLSNRYLLFSNVNLYNWFVDGTVCKIFKFIYYFFDFPISLSFFLLFLTGFT